MKWLTAIVMVHLMGNQMCCFTSKSDQMSLQTYIIHCFSSCRSSSQLFELPTLRMKREMAAMLSIFFDGDRQAWTQQAWTAIHQVIN